MLNFLKSGVVILTFMCSRDVNQFHLDETNRLHQIAEMKYWTSTTVNHGYYHELWVPLFHRPRLKDYYSVFWTLLYSFT